MNQLQWLTYSFSSILCRESRCVTFRIRSRWTNKQHLYAAPWQCSCSRATPYLLIFDEASDDCCPPAALLSRFVPCGLFIVPEVKIRTKRSPISYGRGDGRKFDKGPWCHPAKHVPGRVPELERTLGAVYKEWGWGGEYLEGDKFD